MSDIEVGVRLKADGSGLVGEIRVSREELEKFGTGAQKAGGQADRGFNQARRGAEGAGRQIETLKRQALGLFATFASFEGIRQLSSITDQYASITAQVRLATESQEAYGIALERVEQISQDTSTRLQSTAELFARASRSTRELGIEQERILGITETINQAFAVSQTEAGAQANAITQLTQAFAGGVLRAEEFNSVIENAPRLAEALATGMGVGMGQLREEVNSGAVTVERMIAALEDQAGVIEEEFSTIPLTIGRGWTQISNSITTYIGEADQARGISQQVAESMSNVADNMDRIIGIGIDVALLATTVAVGRLSGALGVNAAAYLTAQREAARYQFTLARMAGVSSGAAAAQLALGRAAGIVRGGLALLGGPLGAAVTGLSLLFFWTQRNKSIADDLSPTIRTVRELADEATRLRNGGGVLSDEQTAAIARAREEINRAAQAIGILQEQRERALERGDTGVARELMTEINALLSGIEDRSDAIRTIQDALKGATGSAADFGGSLNKADQELAILNRQLELMRDGTDASTAALKAQIEAATGTERAILEARLQIAQMRDDAQSSVEPLASISEEMRVLNNQRIESLFDSAFLANLSEVEQQTVQLQRRATDLRELYARTGENRFLEELKNVEAAIDGLADESIDDLQAKLDGLTFGSDFAQGFDDMSRAMGDVLDAFDGLIEAQSTFDKLRKDAQGDQVKLAAIQQAEQKAQVSLYGDMSAAAKGFFDESSAGYKALSAVERGFRAAELAMAASNLAIKLGFIQTETATTVAAAGVKAAASGTAAQASSMVGIPFPANLAALGVTTAALLAIGANVKGAGGGGALDLSGGTGLRSGGTVLGDPDAASDSIENAIDRLADIASRELRFSSQMAASLRNIETALAGVTAEFARFAGFQGVQDVRLSGTIGAVQATAGTADFGGVMDTLVAFMTGLVDEVQAAAVPVSDQLTTGIQVVLDNLGSGIGAAVGALGGDVENALDVFTTIEIPDLQFTEKDNLDEALQRFLSAIGDSAVEIVSQQTGLAIEDLQLFGEGALETLTRVASGVEFARDVAAELDVQLASLADVAAGTEDIGAALIRLSVANANAGTGLAELVEQYVGSAEETADYARELLDLRDTMRLLGDDAADVTREMLNAAGGLDRFRDGLETYREEFFSADEQLAFLRTELSAELAELGLALPTTRDAVRDLIESARGNDGLYGALIALTPEFDRLFDAQEDVAQSSDDAARAQRQLADSIQATTRSLAQEIARLRNESVAALQIGNVLDAIGSATDPQSLVNAAGSIQAALTAQLQEQLDAINAQSDALDAQNQQQIDALNAQIDAVNEQIRAAEQLRDVAQGIRDYVTGLGFSDLGGGTPAQQLAAAQAAFETQAQAALSGDIDAARGLTQIADQALRLNADVNASGPAAAAIREAITGRLSQVADAIDVTTPELQALNSQLAVLEQQRTVLEQIRNNQPTQVAGINSVASQEAEALRQETANQLESVQSILGLLGDLTLLSRDEQVAAMRILQDALATVIRGGDLDTVEGLDDVREAITEASAGIVSGDEALTRIFENGFDSLAGAFGDGIVDLASDVSGLSESLTRATLQNAGDIANAIDQANAAAMANAEIQASAILSPLRLLGIETGNMRSQLVEQFRRQILEQQLTSRLTDILGAETRDVQSLVSAAAQIISGNVNASGADIVRELFGLGRLENLSAEQIADAIRAGDFGLLAGVRDVEAAVRETSAFERQILERFGDGFGGIINGLVDSARQPSSPQNTGNIPTSPGPTIGPEPTPDIEGPTRREVKALFDQVRSAAFVAEQQRLITAQRNSGGALSLAINMNRIISRAGDVAIQAARDAVREAFPTQTFFTFAQGGISDRPAIFGEAGPEAAVPLPDGRTIPVTLSGNNNAEIVRELRASNAELRRQTRELQATVRVLQGGFKRTIQQGDEQLRNSGELARAARLETAS